MEKLFFIVSLVLIFLVPAVIFIPGVIFTRQYSGPRYSTEVLGRSLCWLVLIILLKPIIFSLKIWHWLTGKEEGINF